MNLELDFTDKMLLRVATALVLIIILYLATTEVLADKINEKLNQVELAIEQSNTEIAKVKEYILLYFRLNLLIKSSLIEFVALYWHQ